MIDKAEKQLRTLRASAFGSVNSLNSLEIRSWAENGVYDVDLGFICHPFSYRTFLVIRARGLAVGLRSTRDCMSRRAITTSNVPSRTRRKRRAARMAECTQGPHHGSTSGR